MSLFLINAGIILARAREAAKRSSGRQKPCVGGVGVGGVGDPGAGKLGVFAVTPSAGSEGY